jgi:hypothetical protein
MDFAFSAQRDSIPINVAAQSCSSGAGIGAASQFRGPTITLVRHWSVAMTPLPVLLLARDRLQPVYRQRKPSENARPQRLKRSQRGFFGGHRLGRDRIQNTICGFQQKEAGVTPEARRDRAAISRHDGVLPPFLAVLARAFFSRLSYASIPLAKTLLPRRVTLRLRLKLQSLAPANRRPISSHSRRIFPPGLALPWCEIEFSASA